MRFCFSIALMVLLIGSNPISAISLVAKPIALIVSSELKLEISLKSLDE
ncbi:hypothetical protein [uncultured Holdemanella sp.]|nr:hypothetical protein [uncultured Holdemanella sp.]